MNAGIAVREYAIRHPRLDAAAAPTFKKEIAEELADRPTRVLLDLAAVTFMDSTGFGALVALLKQMGPDGRIAVINVSPAVSRLFQITRLDSLFRQFNDASDALDVLAS